MAASLQLSKIHLESFKNLEIPEAGLPFQSLNVWIGPNGSGKSSIIGILRFLREALIGDGEEGRGISRFEGAVMELGRGRILAGSEKPPAAVRITFVFDPSRDYPNGLFYKLHLIVEDAGRVSVCAEMLSDAEAGGGRDAPFVYFEKSECSSECRVWYFENESGKAERVAVFDSIPANRLTLGAITEWIIKKGLIFGHTPVFEVRQQMIEMVSGWCFYNANEMNLKQIRDAEPRFGSTDLFVSRSGCNLPLVFHNLQQKNADFEDHITRAMKAVFPEIRKIRAVSAGRLRLGIEWHMKEVSEPFYLGDMADGAVRMLLWAVILLSRELPSLLVLDVPETGLHPAWMKTLSEWLKMTAEHTQVIVITHNPDLLDGFTDQWQNVVSFNSDGRGRFLPTRLKETLLLPKMAEGWELGDLYRVGDPAVEGWPW